MEIYWINIGRSKKNLSNNVADKRINILYEKGIKSGALGGKLLGAGGGGFMLFIVPNKIIKDLKKK